MASIVAAAAAAPAPAPTSRPRRSLSSSKTSSTAGCILKLDPNSPTRGVLSGKAFPREGVPVRLVLRRIGPNADALVTNGTMTWMIKASSIICGEQDAGRKRLEIMQQIYDLVLRGEFRLARQVFGQMQRLLL